MKQVTTLHMVQVLPETAVKEQAARYQALLAKLPRLSESEMDAALAARAEIEPELDLDQETINKVQANIDEANKK